MQGIVFSLLFPASVRVRVWKRLYRLVRHQVSLANAMRHLVAAAEEEHLLVAPVLRYLLQELGKGRSLADALVGLASHSECMLLRAGESANLSQGFLEAVACLQEEQAMRRRFWQAIRYPLCLLLLLIGVFVVMTKVLLPTVTTLVPVDALTGSARGMAEISRFVVSTNGLWLLAWVLLSLLVLAWSFAHLCGPVRRVLDLCFPWSLYRMHTGASFLLQFARLMQAGMQPRDIFAQCLASRSISPYLAERLEAFLYHMSCGCTPGEAIRASGYAFPSKQCVQDLALYASLPNFEEDVLAIAQESRAEVEEELEKTSRKIGMFLLLVCAVVVAWCLQAVLQLEMQIAL